MKTLKVFIAFIAILTANNTHAQTVSIDKTFGENGFVKIHNVEYVPDYINHLKFDNYGNIIAIGIIMNHPAVMKTNSDGIVDENFGTNGMVMLSDYTLFSLSAKIYDIKITGENKMLIFLRCKILNQEEEKTIIIGLTENGEIDESYGDSGRVILDDIYYVGNINVENEDFMLIFDYDYDKYSLSKYNYNGEIFKNFGDKGKVYFRDDKTIRFIPYCIKILNDGSFFLAGFDGLNDTKLAFCKINQDGAFVSDFADNGMFIMDTDSWYKKHFYQVIEKNNGELMLIGLVLHDFFISSFNSDGTLNSSFGENGFCFFPFEVSNIPTFLQHGEKYLIRDRIQIFCINNDGTLDKNFNNNGFLNLREFLQITLTMLLQNTDRFIVAGLDNSRFVIARMSIISDVSIEDIDEPSDLSIIFPNPVDDVLYFNAEKPYEIYDLHGKILMKSKESKNSVNISHLMAGVYFIKFDNNKVEKFIKN